MTWVITLLLGVITPCICSRGPTLYTPQSTSTEPSIRWIFTCLKFPRKQVPVLFFRGRAECPEFLVLSGAPRYSFPNGMTIYLDTDTSYPFFRILVTVYTKYLSIMCWNGGCRCHDLNSAKQDKRGSRKGASLQLSLGLLLLGSILCGLTRLVSVCSTQAMHPQRFDNKSTVFSKFISNTNSLIS